jgi:hypothetical protein
MTDMTNASLEETKAVIVDHDQIKTRLDEIDEFLLDPDVQAALNQPNNTPLDTQTQNRYNKAMIRQARRSANMLKGLTIYAYGDQYQDLHDDVTNV